MKFGSLLLYVASVAMSLACIATHAQDGSTLHNDSKGDLAPTNRTSDTIPTSTNSTVPKGTKTYTVSLQTNALDASFAAGILISPIHVLAGGASIADDIRYATIGSHYNNGTEDGEQIKVVAIINHPNMSEITEYSYDFMILQLEKPSSFKPIAMTDRSDVKVGQIVTKLGWYNTAGQGQNAVELQRADVELISNEECSNQIFVDDSKMCSRPIGTQNACTGDYGGPVIVEGSGGDILVGMVSWGDDCGNPGYPSSYSRISVGREWIDAIIRGNCYH
ncbi:Serine protease trypsin-like protein [Phytophthora megakarya]|uniref:Serine protease trypsin-like protein n=1 Tax=Phytophthora megakarya TaxID=4795 RepID=A0A225VIJ9_9STRA|nr:Serine protease trypsin-like protein [Phytophthora megakarya]